MKIEDLKAGDLIIQRLGYGMWQKAKVERTTKTQIIVKNIRYKRNSGYRIGSGVSGSIDVWTEDLQIEWELKLQMRKNKILLEKFVDVVKPENLNSIHISILRGLMREHGWEDQ